MRPHQNLLNMNHPLLLSLPLVFSLFRFLEHHALFLR